MLILALAVGMVSCASHSSWPKPGETAAPAPSPQRLAWQIYLRVTRGELVPLAEIEGTLGPGKLVSPSRTDRHWTFTDSDDYLVIALDSESRATNAYWGLAFGGRTKVSESKSAR
jgi:hypothetical protein